MNLFRRLLARLVGRRTISQPAGLPGPEMVRYLDGPSGKVVSIPAAELRPGCIQVRMEGHDGVLWALPEHFQAGPIQHPPFDEEIRHYIRRIQSVFAEHRPVTVEEWEDGFRRDRNVEREIAIFVHAADVYERFAKDEPSASRRLEIYRLIIACMTTAPDSVWHAVSLNDLTRAEAEAIVRRCYRGERADDPE